MRKALGLAGLLLCLVAVTCAWECLRNEQGQINFLTVQNLRNLLTFVGLFGVLSVGQALVIITGGIDLSVGSVVALVGMVTAIGLRNHGLSPLVVLPGSLAMAALIGTWHGLLITKARIQPFVVTLCGLFFYRGITRLITQDTTQGFGTEFPRLRGLGNGYLADLIPVPFIILLILSAVVAAYLHFMAQGRHLFALGANEEAARFSGIRTDRLKILAYVLCSVITAVGGLMMAFKVNSLGPTDFGSFYELYAIAGAVLGGCSLRGGSGNVLGVIIGATLIVVLKNVVNILQIPSQLEYVVIGGAILLGVFADEVFTRRTHGVQ
ncbi:MAG: ABC transporter permease [Candidatus Hydrogenedentes bacterium]|nr:ABC transporter permease [Candidatus Hydrogenedentota bacterium]